jgi:hypothetical protein
MKKNKLPNIIILLILTAITVVFWVSFSVYRVFSEKPSETVPEELLLEINPRLDEATIKTINEKNP